MKRKVLRTLSLLLLGVAALLAVFLVFQAVTLPGAISQAEERLAAYGAQTLALPGGQMQYMDKCSGPVVLVSHGISGGYDQAYDAVAGLESRYRLLAPSRFGYPGSPMPDDNSVKNQATAFAQLLDALGVERAYVLGTSVGGTPAIRFALDYPERCKSLILYSSAMPPTEKPDSVNGWQGPPALVLNDYMMWAFRGLFSPLMGMTADTVKQILPMSLRREGMIMDAQIVNPDMARHFEDYPIEDILCPVLIIGAKDDKLVDFALMEKAAPRFKNHRLLAFDTGGHLMSGHEAEVEEALNRFIAQGEGAM